MLSEEKDSYIEELEKMIVEVLGGKHQKYILSLGQCSKEETDNHIFLIKLTELNQMLRKRDSKKGQKPITTNMKNISKRTPFAVRADYKRSA